MLFVTTLVAFISFVLDVVSSLTWHPGSSSYAFTFILTAVFGGMYSLGRKRPQSQLLVWPYMVFTLVAPVLAFLDMGGFTGTCLLYAMPILLVVPLILKGGKRIIGILMVLTVVFSLYFMERLGIVTVQPYSDPRLELFDTLLAFIFVTLGYNMVISLVLRASHRKQQRIEELNATKDKFLSIIGHDLKGPLANLMSITDILVQSGDQLDHDTKGKLFESLRSGSTNSYKLVENLLLWARTSSGDLQAKPAPLELDVQVREVVERMKENVDAKKIQLELNLNAGTSVWADRDMLDTVIRNLVSNAIKFTPNQGRIEVSTSAELETNKALITIRDSGMGMSQEVIDKLLSFEGHYSTKGTNNESGTGFGLKLCREFLDKNKGTITIESEINKGSEFTVALPTEN